MRRAACIAVTLCILASAVHGQEAQRLLQTFQSNFDKAGLDVKIQILQDAASGASVSEMGPLFQQAIDFAVNNSSLMATDPRYRQIGAFAAEQLSRVPYTPARFSVWSLFQADSDSGTLVRAAAALGILARGDSAIIDGLNRYLETLNTLFNSQSRADLQVVEACVAALGRLGDSSSFPAVFSAVHAGYPEKTAAAAREALGSLSGDLGQNLLLVIRGKPVAEKQAGLQMALDSEKLSDEQKGLIAETALDVGLHSAASDAEGKTALRRLRILAARALGSRGWAHATGLLIEHLDTTIGEYDKGLADKRHLAEAVTALGSMGSHDAAVRLTQYLLLVNSYTEKEKGYDEQVVLAVIAALGQLGDRVAFDDLMYTQYLGYSAGVKKAARAAIEKLKW